MKQDELLDAFSEINPEYIEEAEKTVVHKKNHFEIKKFIGMAACACLIIGGLYIAGQNLFSSSTMPEGTSSGVEENSALNDSMDKGSIGNSPKEDSSDYMGITETPEKIYYRNQCYVREESEEEYDMYLLTCIGTLGGENDLLHADTGLEDVKVYLVDQDRILIEVNEKQVVYKKNK